MITLSSSALLPPLPFAFFSFKSADSTTDRGASGWDVPHQLGFADVHASASSPLHILSSTLPHSASLSFAPPAFPLRLAPMAELAAADVDRLMTTTCLTRRIPQNLHRTLRPMWW
jgi:hypothetical protein